MYSIQLATFVSFVVANAANATKTFQMDEFSGMYERIPKFLGTIECILGIGILGVARYKTISFRKCFDLFYFQSSLYSTD